MPMIAPARQALLEGEPRAEPGYLRHQTDSIKYQERMKEVRERWQMVLGRGTDREELTRQQALLEAEVAKARAALTKAQEYDKLSEAERETRLRTLQERQRRNLEGIAAIEGRGGPETLMALIRESEMLSEEIALYRRTVAEAMVSVDDALEALKIFKSDLSGGADLIFQRLKDLTTLKIKTQYVLAPEGGRTLAYLREAINRTYMADAEVRYGRSFASMDYNCIISLFGDLVSLLNGMGVGPEFISGVIHRDQIEQINVQTLILSILSAIETPSPTFDPKDLPVPRYKRNPEGRYSATEAAPGTFLEAYADMADHIAHVFGLRLREDTASLKSIILSPVFFDPANKMGRAEDPKWLLDAELFFKESTTPEEQLSVFWALEDTRGQEAFQRILRIYDPAFTFDGKERYLAAAVPSNSMGMLYRILETTQKDIHSWNLADEFDVDARIALKEKAVREAPPAITVRRERQLARHRHDVVRAEVPDGTSGNYRGQEIMRFGDAFAIFGEDMGIEEFCNRMGVDHEYRDVDITVVDEASRPRVSFERNGTTLDMEFNVVARRIIGRHLNKIILEKMADNLRQMMRPAGAVEDPGRRYR